MVANFNRNGRMAVCANNLIRNIHDKPPYEDDDHLFGDGISVEAETTVTGNVIENTVKFGMMLGWGEYLRNVVVTSNVIRSSEIGIYVTVVDKTGPVVISQNIFADTPKGSVVGFRWKEAVTGDLALDSSGFPGLRIDRNTMS